MPNLNPAVNLAGANIRWNYDTGVMTIVSRYGFDTIYDQTVSNGVLFVLDDESADFDSDTFVSATPLNQSPVTPQNNYAVFLNTGILGPMTGAPIDSKGKRVFFVTMYELQDPPGATPLTLSKSLCDFSLIVQKLSPGYVVPVVGGGAVIIGGGPSLCPTHSTSRQRARQ